MKFLSVVDSATVLRLSDHGDSNHPLQEQIDTFMKSSPQIVLDVDGINFSSMLIGELVNVSLRLDALWEGQRTTSLSLVNVNSFSRKVLETVKLTERIPIYDTLDEALGGNFPTSP